MYLFNAYKAEKQFNSFLHIYIIVHNTSCYHNRLTNKPNTIHLRLRSSYPHTTRARMVTHLESYSAQKERILINKIHLRRLQHAQLH